jgi:NAD(P)-dependent dehydrogenase (short-subunit alcohol dehydrogenase family)
MTILITGANRGIGAGLAEAYRATGQEVIAAARSGTDAPLDLSDPLQPSPPWPIGFRGAPSTCLSATRASISTRA